MVFNVSNEVALLRVDIGAGCERTIIMLFLSVVNCMCKQLVHVAKGATTLIAVVFKESALKEPAEFLVSMIALNQIVIKGLKV
jgi:hypothetical protein